MFCKSCGNEIPTGASACQVCGRPVETMVVAEEKKTESVATSAPRTEAASAPVSRGKRKPDKLVLPVVLLALSGAGLVYFYMSGTFSSIMNWFLSEGEKSHVGRPEMVTNMDPVELAANIGAIVLAGIFVLMALSGLVILFKRLGRKLKSDRD